MDGENSDACENVTMSAALVGMVIVFMLSMMLSECGMVMVQRPFVRGDLVPDRMVLLRCVMITLSAVKVALQPESHNCPIESREVLPREGNR